MYRATAILCAGGWFLIGSIVLACNIPVFRYALERWQTDNYQLVVFSRTSLTEDQQARLQDWRRQELASQGSLNLEVLVSTDPSAENAELQRLRQQAFQESPDSSDTIAVLRSAPIQGVRQVLWTGSLEQFGGSAWFESPLRSQLIERLLAGDSGVWLFFPGKDAQRNQELLKSLEGELDRLSNSLPFPSGVGEPGSELYSDVPFTIRFSVLQAKLDEEQHLLNLLQTVTNLTNAGDEAFVVPVYGRGRALEAFGQELITPALIEDVCRFFTGACSCQVKQSNPGFDLPLSVPWMPRLFGDLVPPAEAFALPAGAQDGKPAYVPIPAGQLASAQVTVPGSGTESASQESSPAGSSENTSPDPVEEPTGPMLIQPPPISLEVLDPPSEPVEVPPEEEFPVARWFAFGIIALGTVLLMAATKKKS